MSIQEFRPTRFQILPPVVKNLLILNGLFYFATVVVKEKFGIDFADYLGLHFPTSPLFRPHQYITHLFMHGSFWHLVYNMFPLWMFGNVLENFWGPKKFLIYYLVTGLGAAFVQTLFTWYEIDQLRQTVEAFAAHPSPGEFNILLGNYMAYFDTDMVGRITRFVAAWNTAPSSPAYINEANQFAHMLLANKADVATVGASGAVFGILLAFGMLFPNVILYLYFALPIKAKWFVILYGAFELYSGIQNNPGDNVAHFAHLGGMLFGYFMIKAWRRNQFRGFN